MSITGYMSTYGYSQAYSRPAYALLLRHLDDVSRLLLRHALRDDGDRLQVLVVHRLSHKSKGLFLSHLYACRYKHSKRISNVSKYL